MKILLFIVLICFIVRNSHQHGNVARDIVFLIDGSNSITDADFRRQKHVVANMIDNFKIGKKSVHVGIVVFSSTIGDIVHLQPFKSKYLLKRLAKNLRHPKKGTNTALGIRRVRKMMREEGRSFASKHMVIVTDGRSVSPFRTHLMTYLAKREGINVKVIGVGRPRLRYKLKKFASDRKKMLRVTRFLRLKLIKSAVRKYISKHFSDDVRVKMSVPG